MAFSSKQTKEIESIFQRLNEQALNWQIIQSLPEVPEKNTLYFLQTNKSPKLFEIYHSDKDGDIAQLSNLNTVEGNYETN